MHSFSYYPFLHFSHYNNLHFSPYFLFFLFPFYVVKNTNDMYVMYLRVIVVCTLFSVSKYIVVVVVVVVDSPTL